MKLVLRCASFVISIVMIGLSVNASIRLMNWPGFENFGGSYTYLTWWFTVPVAIISILLDLTELIVSVVRKHNPGLHPGWHIGGELVLLGGNITALIFTSIMIPSRDLYYVVFNPPLIVYGLTIAVISFLGLFTLLRFALFVIASIDTHRYHTAAQVRLIVQALRQQNFDDPTTAAAIQKSLYPKNSINHYPQTPFQDFQQTQFPHESGNQSGPYRELPDNDKFLADLPAMLSREP
jgi:hypothetical protein